MNTRLARVCPSCVVAFVLLAFAPAIALGELPAPPKFDDGWETASPASAHLDEAPLRALGERLRDGTYKNIHSVLLVKDGQLVAEEYFAGRNAEGKEQTFDRDTLHSLQSVSKSVNSILVGIAIDQRLIAGVEEKIATFFPERAELFADGGKDALRLKHLLSMSAGLAWTESGFPYTDPRNDAFGLNRSSDPLGYVFAKAVAAPPGRAFNYHSGLSIVLGQIVHQASGLYPDQFAERHLFGPLGITSYHWGRLPDGSVHTGGGLWLRPRDMAKLGQLFLNAGRWQGKQIVSEEWVRASTKQQVPYRGYGYQWWLRSFAGRDRALGAFAAQGLGGQFIIVIPELQMVAVFTGWNMGALTEQPFDMMQRYVVPAVEVP